MEFYDKNGKLLDVVEWSHLYNDPEYRSIALDEVNGWLIHTVWTGNPNTDLLHQKIMRIAGFEVPTRPHLIFGTALIARMHDNVGPPFIHEARLYDKEETARQGHQRIVDWLRRPGIIPLISDTTIAAMFRAASQPRPAR